MRQQPLVSVTFALVSAVTVCAYVAYWPSKHARFTLIGLPQTVLMVSIFVLPTSVRDPAGSANNLIGGFIDNGVPRKLFTHARFQPD